MTSLLNSSSFQFSRAAALSVLLTGLLWPAISALAQAPDVPIYKQGRKESQEESALRLAARDLYRTGTVAKLEVVQAQLKRASCELKLPEPATNRLGSRELCERARRSHLRVGWSYMCDRCDEWHLNLAGGYPLNASGAVATCYHVVNPGHEIKAGCLVAVNEEGKLFAVTEVLAANRYSDAAIVRVAGEGFQALPLNTRVYPGDFACCYSDPLDHRGYFSSGIINRFYQFPGRRPFSAPTSAGFSPTRLNVSTDWAPGSSGSAVLDGCGNAIGHVSTIAVAADEEASDTPDVPPALAAMIVFHEAVAARDVLLLVRPPK